MVSLYDVIIIRNRRHHTLISHLAEKSFHWCLPEVVCCMLVVHGVVRRDDRLLLSFHAARFDRIHNKSVFSFYDVDDSRGVGYAIPLGEFDILCRGGDELARGWGCMFEHICYSRRSEVGFRTFVRTRIIRRYHTTSAYPLAHSVQYELTLYTTFWLDNIDQIIRLSALLLLRQVLV